MPKVNCWEWKKCGRQEGGARVAELGVYPAASAERINGAHCGLNGGRACWALAGTLCGGQVQGTFAAKLSNCMVCDFFGKYEFSRPTDGFCFTQALLCLWRSLPVMG